MPCSEVRISASSPLRALSSSRNANITVWRFAIEASRHCAQAAEAMPTAAATSAAEASRTSFCTVPSAGLNTGEVRSDAPAQAAPSTQWSRIVVIVRLLRRSSEPHRRSPSPARTSPSVTTHGGTTWMRLSATNGSSPRVSELLLQLPDRRRRRPARGSRGRRPGRAPRTRRRRAPRRSADARSASAARPGPSTSRPIAAAFSTMPSSSIASIEATIDATASGWPE